MDYLKSFENYLQFERRVSPHTIIAYLSDVLQFAEFLAECDKTFPEEVETADIRNWLSELVLRENSPVTVNRKISCLRSFFRFLSIRHAYKKDPARYVKGLKKGQKSPLAIKESELSQLFETLQLSGAENFIEYRTYIVFELLYSLGLRRSELIELKEDDIDFGRLTVRVKGKGSIVRELPIREELAKSIQSFIEAKKEEFPENNLPYLILTNKGKKSYDKMIYLLIRNYLDKMGITLQRKSPHVLRHSFATHLTDRGASLSAVRDLLGHSNLASTQVYLHNSNRKLKEVHKNCLPR
ncbi:MAG: integrase [Saprospirales bacterium]|nr:MAG: integrase [Saprospirales bacterium]